MKNLILAIVLALSSNIALAEENTIHCSEIVDMARKGGLLLNATFEKMFLKQVVFYTCRGLRLKLVCQMINSQVPPTL